MREVHSVDTPSVVRDLTAQPWKGKTVFATSDRSKESGCDDIYIETPTPLQDLLPTHQKARCYFRLSECPLRELDVIKGVTSHRPDTSMNLAIKRQDRFWNTVHVQRKQSGTLLSLAVQLIFKNIVHFDEHLSHYLEMMGRARRVQRTIALGGRVFDQQKRSAF